MTKEERNIKLKHLITCMKCEVSGKCCDENCSTQYDAGNMGGIIENLEAISKILEQESCEDCISREQAKSAIRDRFKDLPSRVEINTILNELPSVTPSYNSIKTELKSCEDCISRKAAIDYCYKLINVEHQQGSDEMNYGQERVNQTETILYHLEFMPSVTSQPKTGHWILTDDDFVYCSECEDSYYPRPIDASWYYCPNCGAKMESEE